MATDINNALIIKKSIYREPTQLNCVNVSPKMLSKEDEVCKMDPKLQLNEIQSIIKLKFNKNQKEILKALQTFDVEGSGVVTKGELRRVLDLYCFPMTTNQYDTFLSTNSICTPSGSVNYYEFMEKIQNNFDCIISNTEKNIKLPELQRSATTFCFSNNHSKLSTASRQSSVSGLRTHISSRCSTGSLTSRQSSRSWKYNKYTIDEIIPILQMQISRNPTALMKAFKLFDFNSDNNIQRHRLKKVLENFCCPLTDQQFDKLLGKFSYSQNGIVNYVDLMQNMGIPLDSQGTIQFKKLQSDKVSNHQCLEYTPSLKLAMNERGLLGASELEDLLIIFRKKIEEQFSVLRKTFIVMDPMAAGFVTLDVLNTILNQFVFPMSPIVFKQLMEKCAFKASGSISWLQFLQKFQDPLSKHLNGSTIAIKSDHKCNPIKGVDQVSQIDELLELLYKHISNNYISFRDAFLQINKTHKGRIPKSEFIKILNQFQFRVRPDQLNSILSFLDPNNRGFISYHHFLELFEQKENLTSHKWLNSNHKVYEHKTNLQLSSETLISVLTDNIEKKWPRVVCEFKAVDNAGSGFISVSDLKKIFIKLFGYLKEEDVDRLIVPLTLKDKKGQINYLELLNLLNVDICPTDLDGLSTQISEDNDIQMKKRHENHMDKMNSIDKIVESRVGSMSMEELVTRVKDQILQNRSNNYELFRKFECQDKKGGIDKCQLLKILNEFGFLLSTEQFNSLCSILNFPTKANSRIDFKGFLASFLDNRESSSDLNNDICFLPKSNHHVNDIRGEDGRNISVTEVEELLRQKIVNNFSDLKTAFHKFDTNSKGHLTKSDFRNFLKSFLVTVEEIDFDSLCNKLGITESSKLTYNDFLDRFQIRDDMVDGHKWLVSKHRFNDPISNYVPEMTADEVYDLLPDKIYQSFRDLSPTFAHLATSGTGFIRFKNLLQLLSKVQIKMSKEEAKKLWKRYDIHNRNKLDYHDFLYNMGLLEKFSSGDTSGPSTMIIQNSHNTLVDHLAKQENMHQKSVDNQATLGNHLNVEHLFEIVKRHLREAYPDTASAFKTLTNKKSLTGHFTIDNLNNLLSQIHLFVTNEKFVQLAARMSFEGPEDSLSYEKFCNVFQDQINIGGQEKPIGSIINNCDLDQPSKVIIEEAGNLNDNQISSIISKKIDEQLDDIEKTFIVMDPNNSGHVTLNQFRNLLYGFCLSLTDKQFKNYLNSLSFYVDKSDGREERFDYRYFLKSYKQKDKDGFPVNVDVSGVGLNAANTKYMSFPKILEYIYESVKARPKLFLKAFKLKDCSSQNFVSKLDFRNVIEQYTLKLSNQDFEKFWTAQQKNEINNIEYAEFIRKISNYSENEDEKCLKFTDVKDTLPEMSCVMGLNDENDEETTRATVEKLLNKHWQSIFNKCKAMDQSINETHSVEGSISIEDFVYILSEFDCSLSSDKLKSLDLYKTCKSGKNIRYGDLIRSIVLSSRGSLITHENVTDVLKKFSNVGIKTVNSDNTKDYFPSLFKLRRQVLENWKTLRKKFLQSDKKQNGTVSGNIFMSIVKTICGQLSPDLFYHLMKLYDYEGTGDFHYKKFIEDFLKTA